jgi:hypothetical protein
MTNTSLFRMQARALSCGTTDGRVPLAVPKTDTNSFLTRADSRAWLGLGAYRA